MKARGVRTIALGLSLFMLTGCWDRTEINENAFWMGTALDLLENKKLRVSAQIAIPQEIGTIPKQGSAGRGSLIISAEGRTLLDTCQEIQNKLPRQLFIGHRRAVFISERLARDGLHSILDMYTRNPDLSVRTGLFVVSGADPEEALKIKSPFNPFSSDAIVRQDKYAKIGDIAARDLIVSHTSESGCPLLSAIRMDNLTKEEKKHVVDINQLALFNKRLQLVGFLDGEKAMVTLWMLNRLKQYYMTAFIAAGNGYVTADGTNLKAHVDPVNTNGKMKIHVTLEGIATVRENNTSLDLTNAENLSALQNAMNEHFGKLAKDTVLLVQKKYRADVFGFGEKIHRSEPQVWKGLREDWEKSFTGLDVTLECRIKVKRIGEQGSRPSSGKLFF